MPILFNLSEPQRFQLAQRMVQRDVPAGEVVFRQGDQGAQWRFGSGVQAGTRMYAAMTTLHVHLRCGCIARMNS